MLGTPVSDTTYGWYILSICLHLVGPVESRYFGYSTLLRHTYPRVGGKSLASRTGTKQVHRANAGATSHTTLGCHMLNISTDQWFLCLELSFISNLYIHTSVCIKLCFKLRVHGSSCRYISLVSIISNRGGAPSV